MGIYHNKDQCYDLQYFSLLLCNHYYKALFVALLVLPSCVVLIYSVLLPLAIHSSNSERLNFIAYQYGVLVSQVSFLSDFSRSLFYPQIFCGFINTNIIILNRILFVHFYHKYYKVPSLVSVL